MLDREITKREMRERARKSTPPSSDGVVEIINHFSMRKAFGSPGPTLFLPNHHKFQDKTSDRRGKGGRPTLPLQIIQAEQTQPMGWFGKETQVRRSGFPPPSFPQEFLPSPLLSHGLLYNRPRLTTTRGPRMMWLT